MKCFKLGPSMCGGSACISKKSGRPCVAIRRLGPRNDPSRFVLVWRLSRLSCMGMDSQRERPDYPCVVIRSVNRTEQNRTARPRVATL